jgi:hypothetical protein
MCIWRFLGGYDLRDIRNGMWREETITDDGGNARLPTSLVNFPFFQVWVTRRGLCEGHPQTALFATDRVRSEGLATPNHCGTVVAEKMPGVFTVFAKGNLADGQLTASLARFASAAEAQAAVAVAIQSPVPSSVAKGLRGTAHPVPQSVELEIPAGVNFQDMMCAPDL